MSRREGHCSRKLWTGRRAYERKDILAINIALEHMSEIGTLLRAGNGRCVPQSNAWGRIRGSLQLLQRLTS
jgi:hypothetical protein